MANRTVEVGDLRLIGLKGFFTPETMTEIPALWGRFVPRIPEIEKKRKPWVKYGTCLLTPDKKLEYAAAVEVEAGSPVPNELSEITIAAGPYALFTHTGHIRDIGATWNYVMDAGMKEEGYIHRAGAYDFELYDTRWNPETGEGQVDLYIAIQRARR